MNTSFRDCRCDTHTVHIRIRIVLEHQRRIVPTRRHDVPTELTRHGADEHIHHDHRHRRIWDRPLVEHADENCDAENYDNARDDRPDIQRGDILIRSRGILQNRQTRRRVSYEETHQNNHGHYRLETEVFTDEFLTLGTLERGTEEHSVLHLFSVERGTW